MSNLEYIQRKILNNQNVYIYDNFEKVAIKITPNQAFVKYKGKNEFVAKRTSKVVFEAELGGEIVDEQFYNNF